MTPFNLEGARHGNPVVTRDGRKVTDLKYFGNTKGGYSIAGVLDGNLTSWTKNGKYFDIGTRSDSDLFMASKKTTIYINVERISAMGLTFPFAIQYKDENDAQLAASKNPNIIKTAVPIEVEL